MEMPISIQSKYFDLKSKSWKEIKHKIDKKLNFDYSHCTWFAIDGEFMGLYPGRDKSVLWTIASEDTLGNLRIEMIYTFEDDCELDKLKELLLSDKEILLWTGMIDLAHLYKLTGVLPKGPIFDIQLASRIIRTYTNDLSMDQMIKNFSGITEDLTQKNLLRKGKEFAEHPSVWPPELHQYNVNDVIYLKYLKDKLAELGKRVGRYHLIEAANIALPSKAMLHAEGFYRDIFSFTYNDTDMTSGTVIPRGR